MNTQSLERLTHIAYGEDPPHADPRIKTLPGIVVFKTDKREIAEAYALAATTMLYALCSAGYPVKMRQPIETHVDKRFEDDGLDIRVTYRVYPFIQSEKG